MRLLKPTRWMFLVFLLLAIPAVSWAQVAVGISVRIGPPAIPVYAQPVIPAPGYIWAPGYWAYGPGGYYWVPGTWVQPPAVGLLWTPGYWGWVGGVYVWHGGYWGPHVGFYGGINYGFGYTGVGFVGGYWQGGAFYYNRAVANVNTTIIHNTYNNTTVVNNNTTVNRTSFNGGPGGVNARPTTAELAAARETHVPATSLQASHEQAASKNPAMAFSANHGQPSVAATSNPGVFKGAGVVAARPASATPSAGTVASNRSAQTVRGQAQTGSQAATQAKVTPNAAKTQQATGQPHPATAAQQHRNPPPRQAQKQHPAEEHHEGKPGKP
jgi:hypothetical protein